MKRVTTVIAVALVMCVVFSGQASADAPMLLNYQGNLTAPDGTPKNGTFAMDFAVYDAESAGNQLPTGSPWGETQSVQVTDGVFNVLLGSVTDLPEALFEGGPSDDKGPLRFLEVVVGGETLSPRKRIGSAAYAINGHTGSAATERMFAIHSTSLSTKCPIPFDVEDYDTGNNFDSGGTYKYTAPSQGYYQVHARLYIHDAGYDLAIAFLYKDASEIGRAVAGLSGSGEGGITISELVFLEAGDKIWVCSTRRVRGASPQKHSTFGVYRVP